MSKKVLVLDEYATHIGNVYGNAVDVVNFIEERNSVELPAGSGPRILDVLATELVGLLPAAQQIGTVGGSLISVGRRIPVNIKANSFREYFRKIPKGLNMAKEVRKLVRLWFRSA